MIEYARAGQVWKFDPLPINRNTAELMSGLAAMAKKKKGVDMDAVVSIIKALPECIARSMRDHHTEKDVNAFIDTILLDFGNPESMAVLGELQMLFMGIDPTTALKKKEEKTEDASS